jgi:hypothetical protein
MEIGKEDKYFSLYVDAFSLDQVLTGVWTVQVGMQGILFH